MPTSVGRRPRDRKAQIAHAAAASFAELGYHRVGIDAVAASVGITGGAVYRHFDNKYELLHQAVFDGMERVEAAAMPHADERLADLLQRLAALSVQRKELGVLLQRESRHLKPADQAELRRRTQAVAGDIAAQLRTERPKLGEDDIALLVRSVFAVLASPSYHRGALSDPADAALLNRMLAAVIHSRGNSWRKTTAIASRMERDAVAVRASRRETLLSVASQLFARQGYAAVRMEDVGAAAGIAGPSIYQHFESKSDLLTAALTRGAEWLQFGLTRALAAADTESRALELVVASYAEFVLENTDLMALLLTETINLPEMQRHSVRRMQHDYVAEWVRLLTAVRPELNDPQARFLTHGVLGIVNDNARSRRARERPDLQTTLSTIGLEVLAA